MDKIPVYCSLGFLQALSEDTGYETDDDPDYEMTLNQLKAFLRRSTVIHTDRDIDTTDVREKALLKAGASFRTRQDSFQKIKSSDPSFFENSISPQTIFFLDDGKMCEILEENFGVMAFSAQNMRATSFLFTRPVEPFIKGEEKQWKDLMRYRHPCNAMIISDPYILCKQTGRDNLKALLTEFLPSRLSISFHLTIIADRDSKGLPGNLQSIEEELNKFLKERFHYPIHLTIVMNAGHDRHLLTNYMIGTSGYGFELLKDEKCVRDTNIAFVPITSRTLTHGYKQKVGHLNDEDTPKLLSSLLQRFAYANNNTPEKTGLLINVVGKRKNRLLETLSQQKV